MRSPAGILLLTALFPAYGSAASFAPAPDYGRLDDIEKMIEMDGGTMPGKSCRDDQA